MLRILILLLTAWALSGCSAVEEALMQIPAKVNVAFPMSPETLAAQAELVALVSDDSKARSSARAEFESRLVMRSTACDQGQTISRFDSIAEVRTSGIDKACLVKQEADIINWLGRTRLDLRLSQAPLRPLKPLGQAQTMHGIGYENTFSAVAASEAGIALLIQLSGNFSVIEIPSGVNISTLPKVPDFLFTESSISPNGRIASIRQIDTNLLSFFDTQTGSKIRDISDVSSFLGWLPELNIALINRSPVGATMLLDLRTGKFQEAFTDREWHWALSSNKYPHQVFFGANDKITIIEYLHNESGIKAKLIRSFSLKHKSILRIRPTFMNEGRSLVYTTDEGLAWLDLKTEEQGQWITKPHLSSWFTKLTESTVLLETKMKGQESFGNRHVLKIDDSTVAEVKPAAGEMGHLLPLGGRTGFIRQAFQYWLGDEVETGPFRALNAVVADLELQMKFFKAEELINATEAFQACLAKIPSKLPIYMIGVYEGGHSTGNVIDGQMAKSVNVQVQNVDGPIVVVLGSVEPVHWTFEQGGGQVAVIILFGSANSTVAGARASDLIWAGAEPAFDPKSNHYEKWKHVVAGKLPNSIRSLQGSYTGSHFVLGP